MEKKDPANTLLRQLFELHTELLRHQAEEINHLQLALTSVQRGHAILGEAMATMAMLADLR